jgi:hypothetical protein
MSRQCSSHSQVTTSLTLEASLLINGMNNFLNHLMYGFVPDRQSISLLELINRLSLSLLPKMRSMAPKSHSAKPVVGYKAKVKSTLSASTMKIKQELLKSRKPGQHLIRPRNDHL